MVMKKPRPLPAGSSSPSDASQSARTTSRRPACGGGGSREDPTDAAHDRNIASRPRHVKTGAGSRQRGSDISLGEIIALEQQRLSSAPRQRVREAVAEIQSRPMSATPAEIAVGFASHVRLNFIERLDDDARLA